MIGVATGRSCPATWERVHDVECVACPDCAFTFDAGHENDTPEGGYTCPNCGAVSAEEETP